MKTFFRQSILVLVLCIFLCNTGRTQNYLKVFYDYNFAILGNTRTDSLPVIGLGDYDNTELRGLDSEGNTLWTKTFDALLLRACMLADNSELAFYTDFINLYIEQLTETGETIWTTTYTASDLDYYGPFIDSVFLPDPVTKNDENEYAVMLIEYEGSCDTYYYTVHIPRFNSSGMLINQFSICPGDYAIDDLEIGFFYILSSTDHISLVGSQYSDYPDYDSIYVSILNLDESGAFISQKNYEGFYAGGATQLADGYFIYGWYQDDASTFTDGYGGYFFMRTDFNGDTLWVDRYPQAERIDVQKAVITTGGNIISILTDDDDKLFLQKSNSDAMILWNTYLPFSEHYADAYDLKALSESKFELIGDFYSESGGQLGFLFVTDSTAAYPQVDITGTVYYDENDNNIYDAGETGLYGQHLTSSPEGPNDYSYLSGDYGITVFDDVPEIDIYLSTTPLFVQSFPTGDDPIIVTPDLSSGYYLEENADFAVQFVTEGLNLKTDIYAGNIAPGFENWSYVYISNTGSVSVDEGSVTLSHPSQLDILATDPPYTSYTDTTISWTYHDLDILETQEFEAHFIAGLSTEVGVSLQFTSTVEPSTGDIDIGNNYDTASKVTVSSIDPNHKSVYPTGDGEEKNIDVNTASLEYTIEFQNTGTGETHFVIITDTLSEYLDINTIEMQASSDSYILQIVQPNIIKWIFNDVHLSPSETDLAGSMGFLKFSIKIKDDATIGDIIENTANIYFDYNPAIITNTVISTLKDMPQAITPENDVKEAASVYPNPASESITITQMNIYDEDLNITIRDITGREIYSSEILAGGTDTKINTASFSPGLYAYIISDERGAILNSGKFEIGK